MGLLETYMAGPGMVSAHGVEERIDSGPLCYEDTVCFGIGVLSSRLRITDEEAQALRSWRLAASRWNDGRYRRQSVPMEDAFLLVSRRQIEPLTRALDQQPSLVRHHRWVSLSLLNG